jgi:hypothetical protein
VDAREPFDVTGGIIRGVVRARRAIRRSSLDAIEVRAMAASRDPSP